MTKWILIVTCVVFAIYQFRQPDIKLSGEGLVVSYKGLVQPTNYVGVENDSCTAEKLISIRHAYIENTLPAIAKAFELGADKVHLNVQVTADNQLAIFHDWTLECRTDGKGVTSKQNMDYLKTLDLGYGYRIAGTDLYPFRGKGVGFMTSLPEVLAGFPEKKFLLNMKTKQPRAIKVLIHYLAQLTGTDRERLSFIGDQAIVAAIAETFPEQLVYSEDVAKRCLMEYVLLGWSMHYPKACSNKDILLPEKYARYLWGWPEQFAARAQANNSQVYLYQASETYDIDSDFRSKGIGLLTGDLFGLADANELKQPTTKSLVY